MGVSGSGKTTLGQALAHHLACPFQDADALHPPANRRKMAEGHPLTDADRAPWLATLAQWVAAQRAANTRAVLACSLLRARYRIQVLGPPPRDPHTALLWLTADPALLHTRMLHRPDHFMPATLLDSQLTTLEPPAPNEHAHEIGTDGPPGSTITRMLAALALSNP